MSVSDCDFRLAVFLILTGQEDLAFILREYSSKDGVGMRQYGPQGQLTQQLQEDGLTKESIPPPSETETATATASANRLSLKPFTQRATEDL